MASAASFGSAASMHRPSNHQIVRAGRHRTGRRHDALLVAGGRTRRPDARRHERHLAAHDLAQARRLLRRTDEAIDAERLGLPGAGLDQIGHAETITRGVEIAVVIGRQHRDGEDLQVRPRARLGRGLHGLRIGVHGQECRAEGCDAFDAARHRVADVVQLEIDEYLLAGAGKLADQRQSAGISELIADLVKSHGSRRAGQSSPPRPRRRADRAPRSTGRGE